MDKENSVKLATPPSPSEAYLRISLIPGMLEAISKNLRYFDEFKLFEVAQAFEKVNIMNHQKMRHYQFIKTINSKYCWQRC